MMNNAQELVISFEPASGASAVSKISPVSFISLKSHRGPMVVIRGKGGEGEAREHTYRQDQCPRLLAL